MTTLAFDTVMPMSILKALLSAALVVGWARWATVVDKDAAYFHLNRRLWNAVQIACAAIAFALLLFVPYYIVGLPLAILVLAGYAFAYMKVRNAKLPADRHWRLGKELLQQMLAQHRAEKAAKLATIQFVVKMQPQTPPLPDTPLYPAHMTFEAVVGPALERNAERIDIIGTETEFTVTMLIDGTPYKQPSLKGVEALAFIDYLKGAAGMDVENRRRQQVGKCGVFSKEAGDHVLRVRTAGSSKGITCHVDIDAEKRIAIPTAKLGLLEPQLEQVKALARDGKRAVLVATPGGHGRTTTLYALVGEHDAYTLDIHTLEPFVERELEGVTQTVTAPDDVPSALKSLLLRDPQVVMIPQVAKPDTARAIAEATGGDEKFRIYTGIRADDTMQALQLWAKAVGDPDLVADGLAGIISQRLVRILCEMCRQSYRPDDEVIRKLNLPAQKIDKLYKSSGKVQVKDKVQPCPACHGIGYKGRTGVFEVAVFDDEARDLIRKNKIEPLRQHLRRQKTLWLQEAALAKVVKGVTSIAEVMAALETKKP